MSPDQSPGDFLYPTRVPTNFWSEPKFPALKSQLASLKQKLGALQAQQQKSRKGGTKKPQTAALPGVPAA